MVIQKLGLDAARRCVQACHGLQQMRVAYRMAYTNEGSREDCVDIAFRAGMAMAFGLAQKQVFFR